MTESELGNVSLEETSNDTPENQPEETTVTEGAKDPSQLDLSEKIKALTEKNTRNRDLAARKRDRNSELLTQLDRSLTESGYTRSLATEMPAIPTVKSLRPIEPTPVESIEPAEAIESVESIEPVELVESVEPKKLEEAPAETIQEAVVEQPIQEVPRPQEEVPAAIPEVEVVAVHQPEVPPQAETISSQAKAIPSQAETTPAPETVVIPNQLVEEVQPVEEKLEEVGAVEEYRVKKFERPIEETPESGEVTENKKGLRMVLNLLFCLAFLVVLFSVVIAAMEHISEEPFEIAGYTIARIDADSLHDFQEHTLIFTTNNNGLEEVAFSSYPWGRILAFFESSLTLKILASTALLIGLAVWKGNIINSFASDYDPNEPTTTGLAEN